MTEGTFVEVQRRKEKGKHYLCGEQAIIIIYSPKWNKCKWTCHLLSELQRNG